MSPTLSKLDDSVKKRLKNLAKEGGFDLAMITRIYHEKIKGRDLDEITENGMTVLEELELLVMGEEGGDGVVYDNVEDYIKSLED